MNRLDYNMFEGSEEGDSCPFCFSEYLSISESDHAEGSDVIQCDDCLAEGPPGLTEDHAQHLWGTRHGGPDGATDCPFCGAGETEIDVGYTVACRACGARGPQGPTEDIARERWQRRGLIQ